MANVDKMYTYLRGFLTGAGMPEAIRALQYARKAHAGQIRRVDGNPYIIHPLGMACYAVALGLRDENVISTILLHDVVEDCEKQVEYLPVNDIVKRAVKYMTITTFDTDVSKIETKCRYFNELLDSPEALICKALDRYNNLTDMPGSFSTEGTAKNIVETEMLLLPILKKAKEKYPNLADILFVLRTNLATLCSAIKPQCLEECEKWSNIYQRKEN
jgi:GTP pyrophosphokinase